MKTFKELSESPGNMDTKRVTKIISKWKIIKELDEISQDNKTIMFKLRNNNYRLDAKQISDLGNLDSIKTISFDDGLLYVVLK